MSDQTIFEKIIAREIPTAIEYEDEQCIAIHDIDPQAPTHILVIPKKRIERVGAATTEDQATLGHLLLIAGNIGKQFGGENGFRLVINSGTAGGETVPHLHVHILAGRQMQWPPG